MAFRVDITRDPLEEAVRAAARAVDAAGRALRAGLRADDGAALAAAVHEARKSLRRARAMAELLRPWLGGEAADDLIGVLRDARRRLAGARDADVLLEALREATRGRGDDPGPAPDDLAALRRWLTGERDAELARFDASALPAVQALLLDARRVLRVAAARAAAATTAEDGGVEALAAGLARLHRRARRATRSASAVVDTDGLHRARRRWKELGYVVTWWSPAWPVPLRAWRDELDVVVDLLGRDHDQAVLQARLRAAGAVDAGPGADAVRWADPALRAAVAARSARQAARLRARALPRLHRLAAEPTGAFVERHAAYLAAARVADAC